MLVDERHIEKDDRASLACASCPTLTVPPTIHALLAARLDRLDPAERADSRGRGGGRTLVGGAAVARAEPGRRPLPARAAPEQARPQAADRAGRRAARRRGTSASGTCSCATSPTKGSSRGSAPICMGASRTGWSARRASARASTTRSSATTSSGPTATCELGPIDGAAGRSRPAPPLDSDRPERARSRAATFVPPSTCSSARCRCSPENDPARRELTVKLGIALAETGQLSRADALLPIHRGGAAAAAPSSSSRSRRKAARVGPRREASPVDVGRRAGQRRRPVLGQRGIPPSRAAVAAPAPSWTLVDGDRATAPS